MPIDFTRRTALYRLYDDAGQLLYVGVAFNPVDRWRTHAGEKPWWAEVTRKTVEWHDTRVDALTAEGEAIRVEIPLYNVAASGRPSLPREKRRTSGLGPHGPRACVSTPEAIAARADLERIAAERRSAEQELAEFQQQCHDALIEILSARTLRPSDAARAIGYDRQHVGRMAKSAGIPPLREATVGKRTHSDV